jgi:hypothetical protein
MIEPFRLIGCFVIAIGRVALPLSLPLWAESEHPTFTQIIIVLVALEIAVFTWVLYYKF